MRLLKSAWQFSALLSVFLVFLAADARAQEKPDASTRSTTSSAKPVPAAKSQKPASESSEIENQSSGVPVAHEDGAEQIRKREEWFYKQRSSVNGHIPAGARLKAFQHTQRMMVAEGKLVQRPDGTYVEVAPKPSLSPQNPVTTTWNSIGPTPTTGGFFSPVTGRVTTIAVDPSDPTGNTVLIGGAMGGIWRTTDAGQTWTAVGDQNASLAMGSIAFASSNHSLVYAGTGESESVGFDVYYGAGVLKSTDGGLHWTQTCTTASSTCPFIGPYNDVTPFGFFTLGGTRITYVAVNPTNPQMVLVGAQTQFSQGPTEGVYCSDDGGATWNNILPDQLSSFVGFASSTVAYAALGNPFGSASNAPNGNGIYKATGIGSTCSTIHFNRLTTASLPLQSSMGRIDLGIAPSDSSGNTVYASIADASTFSSNNLGVFVTTNGGTSWTQTSAPDICQHQCWYDNVVKVDPNNSNIAFFGGGAVSDTASGNPFWVVRTESGGGSWASVIPNLPRGSAGLPHVDNHAIAFVKLPTGKVRMYLGNDGGMWRTDDAEAPTITWTNLNNPSLTLTQFYPSISIHASTPSFAFGGTQDNGSQNYQGPGTSWVDNQLCGDGASTAVDSVIPSTVYIGCATGFPVNASYQNGAIGTFSPAINGINPNDFANFIPPLATDPSSGNTLYFGTTKVYQSVDAGNTWTPISNDLVTGSNGDSLITLAVAPKNPSVVYAGANANANPGGATQIIGLVFVATNVTTGNFANFILPNGQVNLPRRALTAIAVDPSDSTGNTAYVTFSGFSFVSTNLGVNDPTGHIFKTTDGGVTWRDVSCSVAVCTSPAVSDLPNTPVNDIVIDPDLPGIIYAATDEGVFVGDCTTAPCKWSTLGTGIPHVVVLSLRLHEPSRTLRAATHGRGAWDINLNNFTFSGPHISSLSPVSANAGGAQFTLTVNGSGLTGGAVQWNGSSTNVTTTQVSDTKLTASIAASFLAVAGTPKITVVNGAQTSNALILSVLAGTPTLSGISPSSTPVQATPSTSIPITVTGTNFSSSAKVLFNGAQNGITVAAPTASCVLPTCLTAALPATLLGPFGSTNDIAVLNLPPGGGQSKSTTFKVVAPAPPNDNFANAINITGLNFGDTQDSSGATTESSDPTPPCAHQYTSAQGNTGGHPNGAYSTIWYKFTPIFSANLEVDTVGSSYDSVLSIWTGSAGNLTNVACNDDITAGVDIQSQLSNVPLTAGTTYYIMVSSFGPPDPNPIALGGRSQLSLSYNNGFTPAPVLTSVTPNSANSGGLDVPITISGTGFLNGASAQFSDVYAIATLNTTFVSSTSLTAVIPSGALVLPAQAQIAVSNPSPTVSSSSPLNFAVNLGTYPVPTLSNIIPNTVVAGGMGFSLEAIGTNFAPTATLNFNGSPRPSSVSLSNQINASISAADIATVGTAQITVSNPAPGGGLSNPVTLTIVQPNPIPTITSISPTSGQSGFGAHVVINGTNFVAQPSVYFNGNFVGSTFISATQLTTDFNIGNLSSGNYPLTVVDPFPGGSATIGFTVTGPPDFSITASGATAQTVSAGQTATFTNGITVTPQNGFSAQVLLMCSLPAAATATTCAISPNSFATGTGTSSVMVTTMVRGLAPPGFPAGRLRLRPEWITLLVIALVLALVFIRFARTRRQRLAGALPFAVLVLFLVLQAMGCGGGSSQPPPPTGTPAGTYTVTVTGTSGNLTHTTTLTLVVN